MQADSTYQCDEKEKRKRWKEKGRDWRITTLRKEDEHWKSF